MNKYCLVFCVSTFQMLGDYYPFWFCRQWQMKWEDAKYFLHLMLMGRKEKKEKNKTQTNKKTLKILILIYIWVLINFHVFLSFLISRQQQSNSSKIKRNQLHIRPAPGHIRSLTKPTSVSVFRRPLKFYRLGWSCSPLHPYSASNLWTVSDVSILNSGCF